MSTSKSRGRLTKAKQIGFLPNPSFPTNSGNPPISTPQSPPTFGLNDMFQHSQKWFGMFNQLGALINGISPMLRLFQGFGGLPIKYERTVPPSEEIGIKFKEKERKMVKERRKRRR